jgi:hypothetical protein
MIADVFQAARTSNVEKGTNGAPEDNSLETLKTHVFPSLLEESGAGPLRLWVPGCGTGEKAYLLAAALLDFLAERGAAQELELFATDVNEDVISRARAGLLPGAGWRLRPRASRRRRTCNTWKTTSCARSWPPRVNTCNRSSSNRMQPMRS